MLLELNERSATVKLQTVVNKYHVPLKK